MKSLVKSWVEYVDSIPSYLTGTQLVLPVMPAHAPNAHGTRSSARRNIFPVWALGMYRRLVLLEEQS